MRQAATINDFNRQNPAAHERHSELLRQLHYLRLTCRVESAGSEIHVTVAPALPPASYWLDRFDVEFDRNARYTTSASA